MRGSLHGYRRKCRLQFGKRQRKKIEGIMIYFWWIIQKERNRRTFQQKSLQPRQVAMLCKNDMQQYHTATRPVPTDGQPQVFSLFLLQLIWFLFSWLYLLLFWGLWFLVVQDIQWWLDRGFSRCGGRELGGPDQPINSLCFFLTPSDKIIGKALATFLKKMAKC